MGNKNIVKLFDDRKVRTIWNEDEENGTSLLLMWFRY